jgi:hypothetical protein
VIKKTTPPSVAANNPIANARERGVIAVAPATRSGSTGARKPIIRNATIKWDPTAKPTTIALERYVTSEALSDNLTHSPGDENLERDNAASRWRNRYRGASRAEPGCARQAKYDHPECEHANGDDAHRQPSSASISDRRADLKPARKDSVSDPAQDGRTEYRSCPVDSLSSSQELSGWRWIVRHHVLLPSGNGRRIVRGAEFGELRSHNDCPARDDLQVVEGIQE